MTKKTKLTPENSGFLPETELKVTGYEFAMFNTTVEQMFENMRDTAYPIRFKYTDKDGEPVENWTPEQLQTGEVIEVMDIFQTFNPKNAVDAYCGNISYTMLETMRLKFEIHERESKKAVSIEELLETMQKREAKIETITDAK